MLSVYVQNSFVNFEANIFLLMQNKIIFLKTTRPNTARKMTAVLGAKIWCQNSTFLPSVLSKTVENENFN